MNFKIRNLRHEPHVVLTGNALSIYSQWGMVWCGHYIRRTESQYCIVLHCIDVAEQHNYRDVYNSMIVKASDATYSNAVSNACYSNSASVIFYKFYLF